MVIKAGICEVVSSINNCIKTNRNVGCALYSKTSVSLLSFLSKRGFIAKIWSTRVGSNGYIFYVLRRINTELAVREAWSPTSNSRRFDSKSDKYKSCSALASLFTSEFVVVSTHIGLMTANEAISRGLGGVVLCVLK